MNESFFSMRVGGDLNSELLEIHRYVQAKDSRSNRNHILMS